MSDQFLRVGKGITIKRVSRAEFLTRRWHYRAGEHVSYIAPTQAGKTTLAFQMLQVTARPNLPAIVMVMKPRDPVPASWTRHLEYQETGTWPPRRKLTGPKNPAGVTLWPRHTFKVAADNAHMSAEIGKALQHAYQHGNHIVFADEVYGLCAELGLTDELIALWTRGGGMGAGLWTATQRPQGSAGHGIPGHMYSNATHLFLSRDPDARSRQRYGEIGGVNPRVVSEAVMQLRRYEFLYVHRGDSAGGPYMCVINQE